MSQYEEKYPPPTYEANPGYGPSPPQPIVHQANPGYGPPPQVMHQANPGYGPPPPIVYQTSPVYCTPPQVAMVCHTTGNCPSCRQGFLMSNFTCLGIFCAIFFFPIGLLCLFLIQEHRCPKCGYCTS